MRGRMRFVLYSRTKTCVQFQKNKHKLNETMAGAGVFSSVFLFCFQPARFRSSGVFGTECFFTRALFVFADGPYLAVSALPSDTCMDGYGIQPELVRRNEIPAKMESARIYSTCCQLRIVAGRIQSVYQYI